MEKDDSFWLSLCYLAFAVLSGYIGLKIGETVGIHSGWAERYDPWFVYGSYAFAVFLGLGLTFFLASDSERKEYFLQAIAELRKVSWPSAEDTRRMTIIVCVVVGIFALIMLVFDMSWSFVLKGIISTFS